MNRFFRGPALIGLITALSCTPATAADDTVRVYDRGAVRALTADGDADSHTIRRLAANGRFRDIASLLRKISSNPDLSDAARERLLYEGLISLAAGPATPQARNLVATHGNHRSTVFVWHRESRHRSAVPLYPVSAAAAFAQRRWTVAETLESTRVALRESSGDWLRLYPDRYTARDPNVEGIDSAFEEADIELLVLQRDTLAGALAAGRPVGSTALVAARRLGDVDLYKKVIESASPATALSAVRSLNKILHEPDSTMLLMLATDRGDVASAAYFQLGEQARENGTVRSFLMGRLGDPDQGGSAAAALARLESGTVAAELGRLLHDSPDDLTYKRALLALRLDEGDAAKRVLREYLAGPDVPTDIRREAQAW